MAVPARALPGTVRWGMVGCGDVAEVKSGPAFRSTGGFELAAAGKPCRIEKPMAPCHADCLAICDAFRRRGIPLFVAYYRRSLPRFRQVRIWLDEGETGEIRHVAWEFHRPPSARDLARDDNWRTDARVAPGGCLDDVASHGIDLLLHLLGDVRDASGFSTNQQGLYTGKDAVVGSWIHECGATGTGTWDFASTVAREEVEIVGSKGTIAFSVLREVPIELDNANGHQALVIDNPRHIQLYHVRNMRDRLLGLGTHPSTGETAARTSWVMDRILGTI